MIPLWNESFLLKRLDREYRQLSMLVKEYNMIPKDEKSKKRRIEKVHRIKEQYYKIREMEEGWV